MTNLQKEEKRKKAKKLDDLLDQTKIELQILTKTSKESDMNKISTIQYSNRNETNSRVIMILIKKTKTGGKSILTRKSSERQSENESYSESESESEMFYL